MRIGLFVICFIATSSIALLFGCNKKKSFKVKGHVADFYSQVPVNGVKLELDYNSLQGGTYTSTYQSIQEVYSNTEGDFEFDFEYVSAVSFRIRAIKEGYERGEFFIQRDEWTVEGVNYSELKILGQSSLNINLTNNFNRKQYMLRFHEHSLGCTTCCESGTYFLKDFEDTAFACTLYSNQMLFYDLTDVSLGDDSKKTGSIFIEPGNNVLTLDLRP